MDLQDSLQQFMRSTLINNEIFIHYEEFPRLNYLPKYKTEK